MRSAWGVLCSVCVLALTPGVAMGDECPKREATQSVNRVGHAGAGYSSEDIHNIPLVSLHGKICVVKTMVE